MPNMMQHVTIGALISLPLNALLLNGNWIFVIFGTFLGSLLPDIFEPAVNPHHRQWLHSRIVLVLLLAFTWYLVGVVHVEHWFPVMLFYLTFNYILHLLADATTPAGLK